MFLLIYVFDYECKIKFDKLKDLHEYMKINYCVNSIIIEIDGNNIYEHFLGERTKIQKYEC